jgi:hypothetical protein
MNNVFLSMQCAYTSDAEDILMFKTLKGSKKYGEGGFRLCNVNIVGFYYLYICLLEDGRMTKTCRA